MAVRNLSTIITPGLVLVSALATYLTLSTAGEGGVVILSGGFFLLLSGFFAYRYPTLTIILVIILGLVFDHELRNVLPKEWHTPSVGFMKIRYLDPILFGILAAIAFAGLKGNRRLGVLVSRRFPMVLPVLVLLAAEIFRSIGTYGVNTLGEFRTYYQFIFLVPYIVIFFPSEDEQWRLFKVLVTASLLLIPFGMFRASVASEFSVIGHGIWTTSFGNLALVYGMFALFVATRRRLLRVRIPLLTLLIAIVGWMTLSDSHRSVWLAAVAGLGGLVLTGNLTFRNAFGVVVLALLVFLAFASSLALGGIDPGAFFGSRLLAFTSTYDDPTANWRLELWIDALGFIKANPLWGRGLGRHFQLVLFSGEVITTSPHNIYLTILLQLGGIGLSLFAALWGHCFVRLRHLLRTDLSARSSVMTSMGIVALVSSAAFGVAYNFDPYSWLFGSLAVAVLVTRMSPEALVEASGSRRLSRPPPSLQRGHRV